MIPIQSPREQGAVLIIVLFVGIVLLSFTAVSLDMTRNHSRQQTFNLDALGGEHIMQSGTSQALALIRESGILEPQSGGGATAAWISFGDGDLYYRTTHDDLNHTTTIRSWGRIAVDASPAANTVAPDDPAWDRAGWLVVGEETHVAHVVFTPDTPMYMGNGGIQMPEGGFSTSGGADPTDPDGWDIVTSPDSYQASWVPFEINALDHPRDHLFGGAGPAASPGFPHPYPIWSVQNAISQLNTEAWFTNSAGSGSTPTDEVTPDPTGSLYETADPASPNYPYPMRPDLPDVSTLAMDMWSRFKDAPATNLLTSGSHSGTFGTLTDPEITIVTGDLTVDSGDTLTGVGILVIRDDYDPNVDTDNTPSTQAHLGVNGTLEWTGIVIISGWNARIDSGSGSSTTIVGSLFAEDSVMSGSEKSLESAMIGVQLEGTFRLLYSREVFTNSDFIEQSLPRIEKNVVGSKRL